MPMFVVPAGAKSWVESAQGSDFPIQNLPFGCALGEDEDGDTVLVPVVAIGDFVLNLEVLAEAGLLQMDPDDPHPWAEGIDAARELRKQCYDLLLADNPHLRDDAELREAAMIPMAEVEMGIPLPVTAFIDFYSGINHASNVGRMFRPDQPPLLPNYRHLPVAYNGRASSVVPSGSGIVRPSGIQKVGEDVVFRPTQELDFELEVGFYVGVETEMGETLPIEKAAQSILGFVMVNDWSARDIQRFEYQPLGPFLAKSFATSVSPWLVLPDALEPFRKQGMVQDPPVLPHLVQSEAQHYDIELEVLLQTPQMSQPQVICRSNAMNLYWSFAQQLAHQCSNGTPVEIGDLYASGTISGEAPDSFGSLLELTWRGQNPLTLAETGETRTFLEDGDILTMRGFCVGDGFRIGLGEVSGAILAGGG